MVKWSQNDQSNNNYKVMGTYAHTHVDKMGAQKKHEEPWIEMISNIKMNHKGLYLLCSCFFSYVFYGMFAESFSTLGTKKVEMNVR